MAVDKLVDSTKLNNALEYTADRIRAKTGSSSDIAFDFANETGFGAAIDAIPTGGGGHFAEDPKLVFIDYDGTMLSSYTGAEAQALTGLPANPSHNGLVAQGWNWTLQQIKAQLTSYPNQTVYVGQMYITQSGDTEIDVHFADATRLSPIMSIAVNGAITINWGDGTAADTVTGTSLTLRKSPEHAYAATGDYTIVIHVVSGSFQFYTSTSYAILRRTSSTTQNQVYSNTLRAVRFGSGIASLYEYTFRYCYSLASITIPSGVTSIGDSAFYGCYSLKSITIPSDVTSIGNSAFYYCYSLASITIPSGVTSIGNSAFRLCCSLASLTIPSDVASIGNNAFYSCYSLKSVTIPSDVTSIGDSAFAYCSSLASITIPSDVTSIGNSAFYGCYSLKSITIPSDVTSIGDSAFYYCYSLASITIPSGVTSIGNSAFRYCYSLASITIPSGVTSIGNSAFSDCASLASLTIPSGVTSIGNSAFSDCYGMAEYHILPTTVPTGGTSMFNNIVSGCIIYVPKGKLSNYQGASNWSTYASYMQEEP